jgi:PAS domain S-box-containing protein
VGEAEGKEELKRHDFWHYRRLVEFSPDGIFISRDTRIVFLNPAAVRLFGASAPEQVLGKSPFDLFHPESHALIRDRIGRLLDGQTVPVAEERIVGLDGAVSDVEVISVLFEDHDGRAIQVIVRDITERKRTDAALRASEERLTLAFAGAQEGVWDWNLVTGAVVYSPRWKQMLGYADEEIEPHVSAWEGLLHPEDRARADQLNDSVTRGAQTYEGEFRLRHKDGHYIHVLSRGLLVRREPGGPVVRIVGTHFDLTERKQTEEILRGVYEELEARVRERTVELARANASLRAEMVERERAERARTELLTRLVFAQEDERRRIAREMHDQFGEQLTALGLRIGMLKGACGGRADLGEQVEALEAVARQLDRDVDLLVWELRPTALDDLGLRAALANYVRNWSKRVQISAELHASGLLDDRLASEAETTLYRIAQEALTNVAKHAQAENVDVILERRSDHVLLIVEDDGVGFDPGDAGTTGQGFGLQGMQERAALVGATIQIESAAGKGTTILVRMAAPLTGSAPDHA